jgi:diadenylate cyclase
MYRVYLSQLLERLQQLLTRIQGYPRHEVIIELAIVWIVVYMAMRFLRGTRGANVVKGMALLLLVATPIVKLFASEAEFERLNFLYSEFFTFAAFVLIVVFQPELRRGLVRLGEARLFRGGGMTLDKIIEEIAGSVAYLSRNKIGGLIVVERQVGIEGIVEAGTQLDAKVSRELLNTIFWPGSALHDMAVVIRDDRIRAAGVQLPLAEGDQISTELGSRHRAAIGLSQESDATIIVVSEETGIISIAERGQLTRNLTVEEMSRLVKHAISGHQPAIRSDDVAEPTEGAATAPAKPSAPAKAAVKSGATSTVAE